MFEEKEIYIKSKREKNDRDCYMKQILSKMLKFSYNISEQIENSIADGIVVEKGKIKLKLNEEHGGFLMIFNENDYTSAPNTIFTMGSFEPDELNMVITLLNILSKNRELIVLDIGANVGWYTLNILKRIKNSRVYSFEPSPITYERLCDNLKENGLDVKDAINKGLYIENSKIDFYYNMEESGSSSLVNIRETESVKEISVEMVRLDDWVQENEVTNIDFIKCDVEGAEYFVYQGGIETIQKYKPIIFSEMLRKWSAKFGYHPNDIINLLRNIGYECYVIDNGKLRKIIEVNEQTVETNYFFLNTVKHKEILDRLCLLR